MRNLVILIGIVASVGSAVMGQTTGNGDKPSFHFKTIDVPDAVSTQAFGINERGDVVGDYTDASGSVHGFRLSNGKFTAIDFPGAILTSARGINDAGEIVGAFSTSDDPNGGHGYILRKGKFIVTDFPGSAHTGILGINENGDITGSYDLGDINAGIGFFTRGGQFKSFEVPGSAPESTGPHGINDDMQVIGFYTDAVNPNQSHGFLLQHGKFRTIDLPNSTLMGLFGINEHGEIVGSCNCIDGSGHSFLLEDDGFIIVSYPAPDSRTRAKGINDRGQIVGFYQSGATGPIHGFIAKPGHKSD